MQSQLTDEAVGQEWNRSGFTFRYTGSFDKFGDHDRRIAQFKVRQEPCRGNGARACELVAATQALMKEMGASGCFVHTMIDVTLLFDD